MRILVVNRAVFRVPPESSGGGAETHGYLLANTIASLGHQVFFVGKVRKEADFDRAVVVVNVPPVRGVIPPDTSLLGWTLKHFFGNILSFLTALRVLARQHFKVDVIHCHGSLASLLLARFVGWKIPVVYTMHDPTPWIASYPKTVSRLVRKSVFLLIELPCIKNARHILVASPVLRRELTRWGIPPSAVTFVPSGIAIRAHEKTDQLSERYGLFVGRLESRKRVDVILQAMSKLRVPVNFTIVGEGPEKTALVRLANSLGLGQVKFTGFVSKSKLEGYYSKASFFVFPSSAEGLPLALLEAMSYGLPTITAVSSSYSEILTPEVDTLSFEVFDPEQLTKCIQRIQDDHDLKNRLSAASVSSISERFSWDRVAAEVLLIFRQLSS